MTRGDGKTESENAFWASLPGRLLHPTQLAMIEVLHYIDEHPLSASDFAHIFENRPGRGLTSHHLKRLAEFGIVEKVDKRRQRGLTENFYGLANDSSAGAETAGAGALRKEGAR